MSSAVDPVWVFLGPALGRALGPRLGLEGRVEREDAAHVVAEVAHVPPGGEGRGARVLEAGVRVVRHRHALRPRPHEPRQRNLVGTALCAGGVTNAVLEVEGELLW